MEKQRDKISVIIPAYNVEDYIKRAIDSVRNQTYQNLEIIIVDDGSTDSTGIIADKAAKEDSRIKVIHQENGGVSKARNTGIAESTGGYISFVDSDDFIRKDMLQVLLDDLKQENADLVVCAHEEGSEEKFNVINNVDDTYKICVYMEQEKFMMLFNEHKGESVVLWGKLYKAELLEGMSFPEGKIHEDEYIAHYVLDKAGIVAYEPRILYHYYKRPRSITTNEFSLRRLDCIPALVDRIKFFENKGDTELIKYANIDFLKRCQYFYYGVKYNYPDMKEEYSELYNIYKEVYKKAENSLSTFSKIRFRLFIIFPGLNYYIRQIFGAKGINT